MKYPLSYVAAEHQKKKKLFSVSLASPALQLCAQHRRGAVLAFMQGKEEKKLKGKQWHLLDLE